MLPSRRYYLDSIFDNFMDDSISFDVMKCDVYEVDGSYHIEADIPGFNKEEISVECEDGYITISAKKDTNNDVQDENKKYIKKERVYGKIIRKFYVGQIDSERINAEYKNGILKVVVPKDEKSSNKRIIEIE